MKTLADILYPIPPLLSEADNLRETIAVWFSCGAASAVSAKLTIEKYGGTHSVRILNNPVKEEDADNLRFMADVEKWLGVKIETVINPNWPTASAFDVWVKRKYMSGVRGAPCTYELKKRARQIWEETNKADWHVLGFTADETWRHKRFTQTERKNVLPVLIDAGVTKQDCFTILNQAGVALPRIYSLGYSNANCIGCVKAAGVEYWKKIKQTHPDVFNSRAEQSRALGVRLFKYKGQRRFLDELTDDMKGRALANYDFECGIFCEEKR